MLQGTLSEVRFRWPDQGEQGAHEQDQDDCDHEEDAPGRPLEEISRTDLRLNDVCYINGTAAAAAEGSSVSDVRGAPPVSALSPVLLVDAAEQQRPIPVLQSKRQNWPPSWWPSLQLLEDEDQHASVVSFRRLHGTPPGGKCIALRPGRVAAPVLPPLQHVLRLQPANGQTNTLHRHLLVQAGQEDQQGLSRPSTVLSKKACPRSRLAFGSIGMNSPLIIFCRFVAGS